MPVTKFIAQAADSNGERATTGFFLDGNVVDPDAGVAETMRAALQAVMAAPLVKHQLVPVNLTVIGTADAGSFADTRDKLLLVGRSVNGQKEEFSIPCPMEECFQADSENLDFTAAGVPGLISAVEAIWKDSAGGAVTVLEGRRIRTTARNS